jgi:hypothetical protein
MGGSRHRTVDSARQGGQHCDDKVARERIYVMEGWEAPEWRRPWRAGTRAEAPE